MSLFSLSGKTALITGATQGLGFAIAKGLAENGAQIVINARNAQKLESALSRFRVAGVDAPGLRTDFCGHMNELGEENDAGGCAGRGNGCVGKASEIAIEMIGEEGSVGRLNGSFGGFCRRVPV